MTEWSIRNLLNPVITRLLIYGVNPIDVEYVLKAVESKNHLNSKSLEKTWQYEWERKAHLYVQLAEKAEENNNPLTARDLYLYATQCYYAIFLINFTNIEDKRQVYLIFSKLYKKMLDQSPFKTERLEIKLNDHDSIPAYLHLPTQKTDELLSCVVIYSGLGSCKEEMLTLARPLIERGIAVLIPDMPGNGESIYARNVKCRFATVQLALSKIPDALEERSDIKKGEYGVYGLCMGGGYAHHAASIDKRYKACATFFPLFITKVEANSTPRWMKQGEGYNMQTGGIPSNEFLDEMRALEEGHLSCSFLFIHGKHDNWMTLDSANELFEKALGKKEKIIIEETPVYSTTEMVYHTMPVGEQLHWLRHVAADWMVNELQA